MLKAILCTVMYIFQFFGVKSSAVNLALRKPVTRSSALTSAAYAVDGDVKTDFRHCLCCYYSDYEDISWLTIDLGQIHQVATVLIYPEEGHKWYFRSTKIYLHKKKQNKSTIQHQMDHYEIDGFYNYTPDAEVDARYITLERRYRLVICEVEVHAKVSHECPSGVYGPTCQNPCGHCLNSTPCSADTGLCGACDPGYTGGKCTQECDHGLFGPFCTGICRCLNNAACDHVTGMCPESLCKSGWTGNFCDISLNVALGKDVTGDRQHRKWSKENVVDGLYFNHTSDSCAELNSWLRVDLGTVYQVSVVIIYGGLIGQKNHIHLHADQDESIPTLSIQADTVFYSHTFVSPVLARYVTIKGLNYNVICEIQVYGECAEGSFGNNCESTCSRNCNGSCDRLSGQCPHGCFAGWQGYTCARECPDDTHGINCKEICNKNCNRICNKVNGQCTHGCSAGWLGDYCTTECPNGTYGNNCEGICSENCNGSCDHVSGQCTHGCNAGWQGYNCARAISDLSSTNDEVDTIYFASVIPVAVFVGICVVVIGCVLKTRRRCVRTTDNTENPSANDEIEMNEVVTNDIDTSDSSEASIRQGVFIEEMSSSDLVLEYEFIILTSSSDAVLERE